MRRRAVSPAKIMTLGSGFMASKTLLSAVELGLFTVLAKEPLTGQVLAERLELHPCRARDFFDALVALGLLKRRGLRYANTPEAAFFLDRSKPSYIGELLETANARLYGCWGGLTEKLRARRRQDDVESGDKVDSRPCLKPEPSRLEAFLRAAAVLDEKAALGIARKFPWRKYRTFVSLGCAQGAVAAEVVSIHQHLAGIGIDVPIVQPIFESYVREKGVAARLQFHPADFLKDSWPKTNVVVMSRVLCNWNTEEKLVLLRKAYSALPPGGAVIVHETFIDNKREKNVHGLLASLNLLFETDGGFGFTGADCQRWMKEAGFMRSQIVKLDRTSGMAVGWK